MIAGVVIDAWKLDVFRRHLDAAGYAYTEHAGPFPDVITLRVATDFAYKLQPIIEAAQQECARARQPE